MLTDLSPRIAAKIEVTDDGCWFWTAATHRDGYGIIKADGRCQYAHRVIYRLLRVDPPPGTELDHLCRNRRCVNPDHLDAVLHRVNVLRGNGFMARLARQTHCKRGHAFTPETTAIINTGPGRTGRRCLVCRPKVKH